MRSTALRNPVRSRRILGPIEDLVCTLNRKFSSGGYLKSELKCRFRNLVVLAILAACLPVSVRAQESGTVFLVRHAEKLSTARDATLSPQGHKRAECLAHTLGDAVVQVIFASGFVRTQETARPLAKKLGIKATTVEYRDIAGLVEKLRAMPDKTVLVVAHSDTLPGIIEKLGAGKVDPINEDEFDRLFVFHHTGPTSGSVVTLRYCDCP
jgi:broad specificity phosphatase PhoE